MTLVHVLGQSSFGFAQTETFKIDAEQSTISFEVTHLGVLTVEGEFQDFSGSFTISNSRLLNLESAIEVSSINTKDTSRDKTLIDETYLNASNFPLINFHLVRIENTSKRKLLYGQLEIKGVLKDISMPYEMTKMKTHYCLKITTILSRKDFNLDFGPMNALIGDKISVEIKLIFPVN